ncbi:MAG: tyrosine-type recombinase/integrase [Pseudomonadota bacterium]
MPKIKVRGVKVVRVKGREYHYHRATMTRIEAPPNTAAYLAEIERLNGIVAAAPSPRDGTLGGLIDAYRLSPEFTELAPRTRQDYERVLLWLKPIWGMALAQIDTPFIVQLRDKAFAKHKRRFANYVRDLLAIIFRWGQPRGWIRDNPAADCPRIRRPRNAPDANRPWTPLELEGALMAAPTGVRAAIALGAFAGVRQGDVLRLPWSAYDGEQLTWKQRKTGARLSVYAHARLRAILDDTPRRAVQIITGERGRPFETESGFRAVFFKMVREMTEAEWAAPGLTFHGLRHTAGVSLSEAGCDAMEIQAVLGHQSRGSSETYVKGVDQRRKAKAAVLKLERSETNE